QLLLRQLVECALRNAKILGQDVLGRVRHPVGEQNSGKLRKVAVIENEQELRAIGIQSLNRVRNSGGEIPKIVFRYVGDEAFAFVVDGGNPRASVEHIGPLRSGMPMEFADSAGRKPHIHAGKSY